VCRAPCATDPGSVPHFCLRWLGACLCWPRFTCASSLGFRSAIPGSSSPLACCEQLPVGYLNACVRSCGLITSILGLSLPPTLCICVWGCTVFLPSWASSGRARFRDFPSLHGTATCGLALKKKNRQLVLALKKREMASQQCHCPQMFLTTFRTACVKHRYFLQVDCLEWNRNMEGWRRLRCVWCFLFHHFPLTEPRFYWSHP
jgi:hypothetical protein